MIVSRYGSSRRNGGRDDGDRARLMKVVCFLRRTTTSGSGGRGAFVPTDDCSSDGHRRRNRSF